MEDLQPITNASSSEIDALPFNMYVCLAVGAAYTLNATAAGRLLQVQELFSMCDTLSKLARKDKDAGQRSGYVLQILDESQDSASIDNLKHGRCPFDLRLARERVDGNRKLRAPDPASFSRQFLPPIFSWMQIQKLVASATPSLRGQAIGRRGSKYSNIHVSK